MATFDKKNVHFRTVRATVTEMELNEDNVRAAINAAVAKQKGRKAATANMLEPVGPDDKPRMLQISAFICHAPAPNQNDEAFRPEDLQALAEAGLFQAPFFGMIDLNHDWTPRGVWFDAKWEWDATAGSMGLLAKGAIWAWRFPDVTEFFLNEQNLRGFIEVSVGLLYNEWAMKTTDAGRQYKEIHNPVFLTTSVLTEPPADPNATGLVVLDGQTDTTDVLAQILKASLESLEASTEENDMKELMDKITAMFGEQTEALKPLTEAVARLGVIEGELATATAAKTAAETRVGELTKEVETLTASVTAITGEKDTHVVALDAAKTSIADLTKEVEALTAFKKDIEDKAAEVAKAAKVEARKAEIPQVVMASLDLEKDEDKALFSGWMEQTDEAWTGTLRTLSLAGSNTSRISYVSRSEKEGLLSNTSGDPKGGYAIDRVRRKGK